MRVAFWLAPAADTVIVTDCTAVTDFVITVNVADAFPAATVTLPGTVATAVLELVSVTTSPPVLAGPVRMTVPVEDEPPVTLVGDRLRPDGAAGFTVSPAVLFTPPYVAVIVTAVEVVTVAAFTVKVAVEEPAATVTDAGTVAAVLVLASLTRIPPDGAGPVSGTVPATLPPAFTLPALNPTPLSAAATTCR